MRTNPDGSPRLARGDIGPRLPRLRSATRGYVNPEARCPSCLTGTLHTVPWTRDDYPASTHHDHKRKCRKCGDVCYEDDDNG